MRGLLLLILILILWMYMVVSVPTPSNLRASFDAGSSRTSLFSWDYDSSVPVLNFIVERQCGSNGTVMQIRVLEKQFLDFLRGTEHWCQYRVQACDMTGCGATNWLNVTFASKPSAPAQITTVHPAGPGLLRVGYSAATSAVSIINYRVEVSTSPNFTSIASSIESNDGGVFVQDLQLTIGVSYYTRVLAANTEGFGPATIFANASGAIPVRVIDVPWPPVQFVSIQQLDRGLTVSFVAPIDTGGMDTLQPITAYRVELDDSSAFNSIDFTSEANSLQQTLVGLPANGKFFMRVSASNAIGFGKPIVLGGSQPTAVQIITTPGPPTVLDAYVSAPDEITVVYQPPTDVGGDGLQITGYKIQLDDDPGFHSINVQVTVDSSTLTAEDRIALTKATQLSKKVPNLTKGLPYYIRIMASNSLGFGFPVVMGFPSQSTDATRNIYLSNGLLQCSTLQYTGCGAGLPRVDGFPSHSLRMQAYYRFENNTNSNISGNLGYDSSSFARDAIQVGSMVTVPGRLGDAMVAGTFNGKSGGFLKVPNVIAGSTDFTISVWVQLADPSDDNYFLTMQALDGSYDVAINTLTRKLTATLKGKQLASDKTGQLLHAMLAELDSDTWYLVTACYTKKTGQFVLHINRNVYAQFVSVPRPSLNAAVIVLGAASPGAVAGFNGLMDSARFYDRTLSIDEIIALFEIPSGSEELPFPLMPIDVPSATMRLLQSKSKQAGELTVQFSLPTDCGGGLNATVTIVQCRVEFDNDPDFSSIDFVANGLAPDYGNTVSVVSSNVWGIDGNGLSFDFFYIRVFCANSVGWSSPVSTYLKGGSYLQAWNEFTADG